MATDKEQFAELLDKRDFQMITSFRNSAYTNLYTNITFPQLGVRYIAINDSFDSLDANSVNNDFAGIKNWFNEFYARDTSRKIRAVQKAKGERGVPLTTNVPYGYVKDPEDSKRWIIDLEASSVVQQRVHRLHSQFQDLHQFHLRQEKTSERGRKSSCPLHYSRGDHLRRCL